MELLTSGGFEEKIGNFKKGAAQFHIQEQASLLYIYTDSCSSCKMISPVLEKLSKEFVNILNFYKVNADDVPEFCEAAEILSVPKLIFIRNGVPSLLDGVPSEGGLRSILNYFTK